MSISISIDLRSTMPEARDQGQRDTCFSLAATAAHECIRPDKKVLSAEYLHYYAATRLNTQGASPTSIKEALRSHGQPADSECPYSTSPLPSTWKPPKPSQVYKRQSNIGPGSISSVIGEIKKGRPAVVCMSLPGTFFQPTAPWIISTDGSSIALHAMLAVGLGTKSGDELLLVRNSWGAQWGDRGHVWLDSFFVNSHLRETLLLGSEAK